MRFAFWVLRSCGCCSVGSQAGCRDKAKMKLGPTREGLEGAAGSSFAGLSSMAVERLSGLLAKCVASKALRVDDPKASTGVEKTESTAKLDSYGIENNLSSVS